MVLLNMKIYMLMVLVGVVSRTCHGAVEPLDYFPTEFQNYLDTCRSSGDLTQQSGQLVFWTAINQYTAQFVNARPNMTQQQAIFFHQNLQQAMAPLYMPAGPRQKRQATGRRIRREIRAMSIGERRRYFRALNNLKRDTRLQPNVYDFLSAFHAGDNVRRAHFGPAFASWHRLYLWILEFFLRQHDPRVTIPYWASVLDNDMADPTDTVIFSPAFYGSGAGQVNDGPFRTWAQINPATAITRNVQGGQLYTYDGIQRILAETRARDITIPTALPGANFEMQHGAAHVFVGGTMNDLNTAARDPLFYSHHCFVDQIWERFRFNQRNNGIDPQQDYPFIANDPRFDPMHAPTATAGFTNLPGADQWPLSAGNLNAFSAFVAYEEVPSCENRCANSQFLRCNQQLNPPRCVSRSRSELQASGLLRELNLGQGQRKKRQAVSPAENYLTCPRRSFLNDVDLRQIGYTPMTHAQNQNSWAYVPVKIVSKRPTEYNKFNKYSLYPMGTSNAQLGLKNNFMEHSLQKPYETCDKFQGTVGKIKIVAYGLNHKGYSEEYVVVDNRLGVSESIGYLPIKLPTRVEPSDVVVAAFDSCGRVCRPYCQQGMAGGMSKFTGAVRVSATQPLQYAYSYSDATLQVWDIPDETACPTINYNNVPVSFFCEYTEPWIWSSAVPMRSQTVNLGNMLNPMMTGPQQISINIPPRSSGRGNSRGNRGRGRTGQRGQSQRGRSPLPTQVNSYPNGRRPRHR